MRRITALLLMLLLLPGLVAAEDDFDLDDILSDADPDVVKNTYSQPGNADDILLDENNEPVSIYEEDGSILITLTATGDFTVGGDSRKSTSIWMNELKKHDNDYNFALANVRDIFLADDLTIVNFEGTLTDSTYVPSEKRNNGFGTMSFQMVLLPAAAFRRACACFGTMSFQMVLLPVCCAL